MRVFIKYASVFEIGPGHGVSFPIFILSKPENQKLTDVNVDDIAGLVSEFDHEVDLQNQVFEHKRDHFWEELGAPEPAISAQLYKDKLKHEMKFPHFDKTVIDDVRKVQVPSIESEDIFVVGWEDKKLPWIDHSEINSHEWRQQNRYPAIANWSFGPPDADASLKHIIDESGGSSMFKGENEQ